MNGKVIKNEEKDVEKREVFPTTKKRKGHHIVRVVSQTENEAVGGVTGKQRPENCNKRR